MRGTLRFNQDATCAASASRHGAHLYTTIPLGRIVHKRLGAPVAIAEPLASTALLALVHAGASTTGESPRRLQLWNMAIDSPICELSFSSAVLAVRMNRARLVAVLETRTHIFELSSMRLLHTLETAPNRRGIAELCTDADVSYCALPAHRVGLVLLFDARNLCRLATVQSRRSSALAALAISSSGGLLATASEKGTVIHVHALPHGDVLHSFRRGSLAANIYSLSFSVGDPARAESAADGGPSFLCAAASSGTVHVWSVAAQRGATQSPTSSAGASSQLAKLSGLSGERAYAHVHLASSIASGGTFVASVRERGDDEGAPSLWILCESGVWLLYRFDAVRGGECELVDERRISRES